MLVLRRRAGETIVINNDVEISIIEISRTRVKIGVTAPRSTTVQRGEMIDVAAENRRASSLIAGDGMQSVSDILKLLKSVSSANAKALAGAADKYSEDTLGIAK